MPGIRLSRSSSARNVLANKDEDGNHVEEEYDYKAKEGVGLPNRKALDLLRRLNEAVNESFHPVGISFYDKVQSVKVSNVEKVLSTLTWREFFNGKSLKEANEAKFLHSEKEKQEREAQQSPNRKTALPRFVEQQNSNIGKNMRHRRVSQPSYPLSIEQSFENMLSRVSILWKELRIPNYERDFYTESLLTKPYSIIKCKALATYVVALQTHRDCTSEVLHLINKREVALKEAHEALLNVFKPRPSALEECGGHVTKIRSLKESKEEKLYEPFSPNRMHLQQAIFKEELLIVLKKLQMCTLHVIRAIQIWRKNLWRPLPFLWVKSTGDGRSMAVDYLLKIKDDLLIIDTNEVAAEFINSIPLAREDLHLILFDLHRNKFAETRFEDSYGTYESTKDSDYFQPEIPRNDINTPQNKYVKAIKAFAKDELSKNPLRDWFVDHEDSILEEFKVALDVVVLQPFLLSTLYKENDIMRRNGSFIPNLKVTFDNIRIPDFKEPEREEEEERNFARMESDVTVERHKKTSSFKQQRASSPLFGNSILSAADDSLNNSFEISPRKNKTVVIIDKDQPHKHVHYHHSESESKSKESKEAEDDHDHRIVHHYDEKEECAEEKNHEHRVVHHHHHEDLMKKESNNSEHRIVHKHHHGDGKERELEEDDEGIDPKLLDALNVIDEAQEKQTSGKEVDEEDEYSMHSDAFHAESDKVTTSYKNQSDEVSQSGKSGKEYDDDDEEWMLADGYGKSVKVVSRKSDHYEDDFES